MQAPALVANANPRAWIAEDRGVKRALPIAVLAVALSAMSPAAAPAQTGTLINNHPAEIQDGDDGNQNAARRVTNDYAQCLVRKYGRLTERAVAGPASEKSAKLLSNLASPQCLSSGELRMPQALMRGAVFRALYIRAYGRAAPANQPVVVDFAAELIPGDELSRRMSALLPVASCVAHGNPDATRAFILAQTAAKAEQAAIEALRPALSACLPAQVTLRFSKAVLQGMLAEAVYREVSNATGGVAVAGKK
jgi:hypothetical protein